MTSDNATLEQAYAEQLGELYKQLFSAMVSAQGDDTAIAQARTRFHDGWALAGKALKLAQETVST